MNRFHATLVVTGILVLGSFAPSAQAAAPQPLKPAGRIQNKTPLFKWTDTGAARYTIRIAKDQESLLSDSVKTNSYSVPGGLDAGVYAWRVKEGPDNDANTAPWSAPLAFTVLPETPILISPSGWLNVSATNPIFRWSSGDWDITRFTIQLFRGPDLLGSVSAPGFKSTLSCSWTSSLPVGIYAWRIRGIRDDSDPDLKILGDWSDKREFAVGIPFAPVITTPAEDARHSPGTYSLTVKWSPVMGAASYNVKLIRNGHSVSNVTTSSVGYGFNGLHTPGHYFLLVRSWDSYGFGPWSQPRNFEVWREMAPHWYQTLDVTPAQFTWTQTADGTGFVARLFKYSQKKEQFTLFNKASFPSKTSPAWTQNAALPDGIYRWSVTDYRDNSPVYTSVDYFQIRVPAPPTLHNPLVSAIGHRDLEFVWKPPMSAVEKYQIQLFKGTALIQDSGWTNFPSKSMPEVFTTYSFPATPAVYRWRVRARNSHGIGPWFSAPFSLTPLPAPTFPIIMLPLPHPGDTFTVHWIPVNQASRYQVRILKNGLSVGGTIQASTPAPVQQYAFIAGAAGTYKIKIRAGADGWGPWAVFTLQVLP